MDFSEKRIVVGLLLGEHEQRPWSKEAISREVGDDPATPRAL